MTSLGRAWHYAGALALLLLGLALLFGGGWLTLVRLRKTSLVCSRATSGVVLCSVVANGPPRREVEPAVPTFEVNAFHRSGRSQRQWEIVLYDERGAETLVATIKDTGEALRLRDRIDSALADPSQRHFELALPRDYAT